MKIIITALFGLESLVCEDLQAIGYGKEMMTVSDGVVSLDVPASQVAEAVARVNMWVRTGERVLLELGRFHAQTFDQLFDGISAIPWEDYVPKGFAFHINGYSRKSDLFGISACQSISKKAVVKRLLSAQHSSESDSLVEDERIGLLKIQFGIVNNTVSIMVDTSGEGLHKRGYRPLTHQAPIKETLAAGLVRLSRYTPFREEALVDPFCGSGTIVIEAAMDAFMIAPGLNRPFSAESWPFIGKDVFMKAREEAQSMQNRDIPDDIYFYGSDLDKIAIDSSMRNARAAGVEKRVRFLQADAYKQGPEALKTWTGLDRQLIVCNPPYGERLLNQDEADQIYKGIARTYLDDEGYCKKGIRLSVISPDDTFEGSAVRPADKRRKLYNGNIRCQMYHYFKLGKSGNS
jgi:putative N6-adenine-specific DNA methylase